MMQLHSLQPGCATLGCTVSQHKLRWCSYICCNQVALRSVEKCTETADQCSCNFTALCSQTLCWYRSRQQSNATMMQQHWMQPLHLSEQTANPNPPPSSSSSQTQSLDTITGSNTTTSISKHGVYTCKSTQNFTIPLNTQLQWKCVEQGTADTGKFVGLIVSDGGTQTQGKCWCSEVRIAKWCRQAPRLTVSDLPVWYMSNSIKISTNTETAMLSIRKASSTTISIQLDAHLSSLVTLFSEALLFSWEFIGMPPKKLLWQSLDNVGLGWTPWCCFQFWLLQSCNWTEYIIAWLQKQLSVNCNTFCWVSCELMAVH